MNYSGYDSFNELVMREIGLDIEGPDRHIIDQDTFMPVICNNKFLTTKTKEEGLKPDELLFDPIHNTKQMQLLFGYYSNKLANENGSYISTIYSIPTGTSKSMSFLAIKVNGKELISRPYLNESVKYADLIYQLNGAVGVNLSEFDTQPVI